MAESSTILIFSLMAIVNTGFAIKTYAEEKYFFSCFHAFFVGWGIHALFDLTIF